ncbi:CbtB-domain containing protein [Pseudotabrizicola sediminis]|uniref:CbtB-domain containing protein n=1 Tax=Pseudotabrizicola sediminis TaxID=2486418 RepID=A0ABY2KMJ0_9RHOB|nr:CbtB domain-containing protein [Pseudotabrizicola sediminis]TGD42568.1 CbtB-domain containing protein [Pseudotabrizicola sediminis]
MTPALATDVAVAPLPAREVLPWALFGILMLAFAIYFVGAEQGASAVVQGDMIHEFMHDGRHLLGFPCH